MVTLINSFLETPPAPSATYWRIRPFGGQDSYVEIADLAMAATIGGADQCSGGSAITGGFTDAANAFDGTASYATTFGTLTGLDALWIGYAFASAVTVESVRLQANTVPARAPQAFFLDYSLNSGSTWVPYRFAITAATYSSGETKTFTLLPLPTTKAAALIWSMNVSATPSGFAGVVALNFRASSGGANLSEGAVPWCSRAGVDFGTYGPAKYAFDANAATFWYAGAATGRLIACHTSAPNPSYMAVQARPSFTTDTPSAWTTEYTLDGITWTQSGAGQSGQVAWAGGEIREYAI